VAEKICTMEPYCVKRRVCHKVPVIEEICCDPCSK
jgi:hypothetical protein